MSEPARPVIRYFGGKWILAPWIISHMPPHKVYVEPYGGAASVLMRKPRAYAEVYNDMDGEIVSLFQVLRDPHKASILKHNLEMTPFSRDEFDEAYEPADDEIDQARKLIIRAYMGFGADGHNMENGKTGFRAASNRSGTTPAHDWRNFPKEIQTFCERLAGVVIENKDAREVMAQHDSPQTLHFVDPPYVHGTRSRVRGYKFELSDADHRDLCAFLKTLKGMVLLCGYDNEIYSELGWETVRRPAHADGALDRMEVLWLNPAAWQGQSQMSLDFRTESQE